MAIFKYSSSAARRFVIRASSIVLVFIGFLAIFFSQTPRSLNQASQSPEPSNGSGTAFADVPTYSQSSYGGDSGADSGGDCSSCGCEGGGGGGCG